MESAGEGFDQAATEAAWEFYFSPAEDSTGPIRVQINWIWLCSDANMEGAVEEEQPPQELPVNLDGTLKEMGTERSSGMTVIALEDGSMMETQTDQEN